MKDSGYTILDYIALREEGRERGWNGHELSKKIGKHEAWLEQCVWRQKHGQDSMKGESDYFINIIETMTGIPRENFIRKPASAQKEKQTNEEEAQEISTISLLEKISKQLAEISGQLLILPKIMDSSDSLYFQLCDMGKDLTKITEVKK